jgi:TonB family protein
MIAAIGAIALLLVAEEPPPPEPPALTKAPKLVQFVEAEYPPEALKDGREGTVGLWIDVDEHGAVTNVELAESGGEEFDRPAIEAAWRFVFEPAEAEGIGAVPVRIRYRYRFVLREETETATPTAGAREPEPAGLPIAPINFRGTVREAGSRSVLPFASVEVEVALTSTTGAPIYTFTATDTDRSGRFALRGLPPGEHIVRVSAPFFEMITVRETIERGRDLEVLYFLERTEKSPYEIIVRARPIRKEVARRTLTLDEIRRVPGAQGDAIRVIQNLPGVARTPYGLGLLVVRGAPPQSTGVFLDGHRMPLLFHFGGIGGLTSVVNSRMLEQINFYPGGFSPAYGRVSAGAVELISREAATDRVHGEAQVDFLAVVPIQASVYLEGPLTSREEDGAFVFSLRRSSVDGVFALITELADSSVALAPRYYDYQLRYDRPIGGKDRLFSILAYGSDDELVLVGADDLGPNAGGPSGTRSRTWFHRLNPRFTWRSDGGDKLVISPLFGIDFTDSQTTGGGPNGNFSARLSDWNAGARIDGATQLAKWLRLEAGAELLYFEFKNDTELPAFGSVKDFPSPISTDLPTRHDVARIPVLLATAYVEFELEPFEGLTLWPGLRLDGYDFEADPQPLLDPRLIDGRTKIGIDPRITARYEVQPGFALKAQAGVYREPPLPPQLYLNADLPLQSADQYSAGFELEVVEKLLLDLQGYYRFAYDVPRGSGDVEVVNGVVRPVGFREDGEQRSFGMELLLKLDKRWDLFGWVSYTLSRSEQRRVDDEFETNFFFDQTHNLNVVAVYELGLDWRLGIRFRYVTGGGLPATVSRWYDADRDAYSRRISGQTRAPDFHQLDLYAEKQWTFDEWYLRAYLDIQNFYNHTNTELYAPTFDFKDQVAIPGLPIFPSIGLRGEF